MLEIQKAVGFATVQDRGWPTGRAIGLPQSGAMDLPALERANALVGNSPNQAGIELAVGSLTIRFQDARRFAITGARTSALLDGVPINLDTTQGTLPGQTLVIGPTGFGRFGYLAVGGGIAVPITLGARATYLPTGIGGHHGRLLRTGDRLPVADPKTAPPIGTVSPAPQGSGPIRIVAGPQADLFPTAAWETLLGNSFRISPTSDRMGVRLTGAAVLCSVAATLPSEGTAIGAIQVPDDGQPIVIGNDGPTVGGYPKIAAVITADRFRLIQVPPGEGIRFGVVSLSEAHRLRTEAIGWHREVLATVERAAR